MGGGGGGYRSGPRIGIRYGGGGRALSYPIDKTFSPRSSLDELPSLDTSPRSAACSRRISRCSVGISVVQEFVPFCDFLLPPPRFALLYSLPFPPTPRYNKRLKKSNAPPLPESVYIYTHTRARAHAYIRETYLSRHDTTPLENAEVLKIGRG